MPAMGTWITTITNLAATSLGPALFGVALLMSGISFLTGNRDLAKVWLISGVIGFGVISAIAPIIASIPRPA